MLITNYLCYFIDHHYQNLKIPHPNRLYYHFFILFSSYQVIAYSYILKNYQLFAYLYFISCGIIFIKLIFDIYFCMLFSAHSFD